jgi:hypothetical protein
MKSNLRLIRLALCMLPIYVHAATGQDMKPAYEAAQPQNARSAEPIPAGTILPVRLNSSLRSDKSQNGEGITATVMQDVPLEDGVILPKGSRISGRVVEAASAGQGSDAAKISFQLDEVQFGGRTVPITTELRAVASPHAVVQASPQPDSSENTNYEVEIGGDQISYGEDSSVMVDSQVVGKYTKQGALANVSEDSGTQYHSAADGNARPQAFWLFSVNARGAYGFRDLKVVRSGLAEPLGEVTLTSNRKVLKIGKGSALLLRVEGSGSASAQARSTVSREMAR